MLERGISSDQQVYASNQSFEPQSSFWGEKPAQVQLFFVVVSARGEKYSEEKSSIAFPFHLYVLGDMQSEQLSQDFKGTGAVPLADCEGKTSRIVQTSLVERADWRCVCSLCAAPEESSAVAIDEVCDNGSGKMLL